MKFRTILLTGLMTTLLIAPAFAGQLIDERSSTTKNLLAVDWHPNGTYALVVGDGVYKLTDNNGYKLAELSPMSIFEGVAWRPQGDYALLVGDAGLVVKYDGTTFTILYGAPMMPLKDVAFSPDGMQALIVGSGGAVVAYHHDSLYDHSVFGGNMFEGVTWSPDGSHALLASICSFSEEKVFRWDGSNVTEEWVGSAVTPGDITYHPSGDYALIIEDWGHAATYDATGYHKLTTGFEQETDGLNCAEWSPDGSTALMTGAWYHGPFGGLRTLAEFDGERFNTLRMFEETDDIYEGVSWKNDSSEATVVGKGGQLARYLPEVKLIGAIRTNQTSYTSNDTLVVKVDCINNGPSKLVDIYVSYVLDFGTTYYWPTLTTTPFPLQGWLHTGMMVEDFGLWHLNVGNVPGYLSVDWELWIFEAGSGMNVDSLYSYSSFYTTFSP